ncbi:hypothetical protein [Methylomagnum sp.]
MPWQIIFQADARIVETVYSGVVKPDELMAACKATLAFARENSAILFLGDCMALQGGHSVFDLYAIVDVLETHGFPRAGKEALLFPPLELSDVSRNIDFWETACGNRGYVVRVFHDREAALRWLIAK